MPCSRSRKEPELEARTTARSKTQAAVALAVTANVSFRHSLAQRGTQARGIRGTRVVGGRVGPWSVVINAQYKVAV